MGNSMSGSSSRQNDHPNSSSLADKMRNSDIHKSSHSEEAYKSVSKHKKTPSSLPTPMEKTFDIEGLRSDFETKLRNQRPSEVVIVSKNTVGPFTIVKTLGTGTFGRVLLVKSSKSSSSAVVEGPIHNVHGDYIYSSLKLMRKRQLMRLKQLDHIMNEKRLQSSFDFPFLISCQNSFKDNSNVFLQMEYMPGGEMFTHLRKARRFNENLSKFYASQVVLAFEYLHGLTILYRDLKPENILMSTDGYIKIADFGFAKQVKTRTWTMCGTPEYLAPEILLNKGYNSSVDWWALGVLVYEMCAGCPPFYESSPMKIYEKILHHKVKFLPYFSHSLKDLLKKLLETDVTARIGNLANGVDEIKCHQWFDGHLFWKDIYNKQTKSIYSVSIKDEPENTVNFDSYEEEEISSSEECLFEDEFKYF